MNKRKFFLSLSALALVFLVSCGEKKTEVSEQPSETPAGGTTPVDQSTVGSISGKITFEGAKAKLAVIHMDQDPVCVQKHSSPVSVEDGEVNANGTLPNVFVCVKQGADKYRFPAPT